MRICIFYNVYCSIHIFIILWIHSILNYFKCFWIRTFNFFSWIIDRIFVFCITMVSFQNYKWIYICIWNFVWIIIYIFIILWIIFIQNFYCFWICSIYFVNPFINWSINIIFIFWIIIWQHFKSFTVYIFKRFISWKINTFIIFCIFIIQYFKCIQIHIFNFKFWIIFFTVFVINCIILFHIFCHP